MAGQPGPSTATQSSPRPPHRRLLLLLAWELPTPGCSGLCRFCRGRRETVRERRDQHGSPALPCSPPTFFFFFSFFFLFRSGSSSFFFFFFLWSESEGVSGGTRGGGLAQEGGQDELAASRRGSLPGGTGSWVRLCLCLCLFFFLGGWMCISRHCSGSCGRRWGGVRGRWVPSPYSFFPPAPKG